MRIPALLSILLLPLCPLRAQVLLSEFLAGNSSSLTDEDGDRPDWIELANPTAEPVSLAGWRLTGSPDDPDKWVFPAVTLPGNSCLVVFASDKNRRSAGGELHTNFKLGAAGEYLALLKPDGSVATEYAPAYPPQTRDVSYGMAFVDGNWRPDVLTYFAAPTPGASNGGAGPPPGPSIAGETHSPQSPGPDTDLIVTCRVLPALAPVASVTLEWRTMFNDPVPMPMADDGAHGDGAAGDGMYGAVIPSGAYAAGQIVRWRFLAADADGRTTRWPTFADPENSPEYFGTRIDDPEFSAAIPVWHWFARSVSAAGTRSGTRGCVVFRDRFYDNVFIRQRGGATSTNSKKFDFNTGYHCFIDDETGYVEEANVNFSSQDNTLIRPTLAFEFWKTTGHPSCAAFPVLMRNPNAAGTSFTSNAAYFVEQVDERFLRRHGLDDRGALYKFDQRSDLNPAFHDATNGVEKNLPENDNDRSDLRAVVAALRNRGDRDALRRFMFDNFDLANMANYLACRAITNDYDDVRKNWYFYRDTYGTGEWLLLPWDKDGTWGIQGDAGSWWPHPLYGDQAHLKSNANQWSYLWDALHETTDTREMYLRRLRTLMDTWLQPRGLPASDYYLTQRIDYWWEQMAPYKSGVGTSSILSWLNTRRNQLFTTYSVNASNAANRYIPDAQSPTASVSFGAIDANPDSGNQAEEFVEIVNPGTESVDISDWTVTGGIDHTFRPGTVVPAGSRMYLARDAAAFRARTVSPRGGEGHFVQGNYAGSISARGETLALGDPSGRTVETVSTPADPTPAQRMLRITEIMYHPADGGDRDADDYEFIELHNAGSEPLDLGGISFADGISFTFPSSGPFAVLEPGGYVLLAPNQSAFVSRYGGGLPLAGIYTGALANSGERIRLLDAAGEEILDFVWSDAWFPATDGGGYSLTISDETLARDIPDNWNLAASWTVSRNPGGSPGTADSPPPSPPPASLRVVSISPSSVTFAFAGEPSREWWLERSTDLAAWQRIAPFTTDNAGRATPADAPPPGRSFYRVTPASP